VLKKQGDNKKIGKPDYQDYPSSHFGYKVNPSQTVFLQIFKEDLHPTSASRPRSFQRLPGPALPGVHRRYWRYEDNSGDT